MSREHVLVGLSSSPTNARIIASAAKMADAFDASFSAVYVQTAESVHMDSQDQTRLQNNIRMAKDLGASVTTVYGEDIPFQIAEFARRMQVTKLVIGHSSVSRRHFWQKDPLEQRLMAYAPNAEIYIIPDAAKENYYHISRKIYNDSRLPSVSGVAITFLTLFIVTLLGHVFDYLQLHDINVVLLYGLGVLLTALYTRNYFCSVIGSVLSVIIFNFFFTEPRFSLRTDEADYFVTFVVMLITSLITSRLANQLMQQTSQSTRIAFSTRILFDTNRRLQQASDEESIFRITASQLMKLLNRSLVLYEEHDGHCGTGFQFNSEGDRTLLFSEAGHEAAEQVLQSGQRHEVLLDDGSHSAYLCLPVAGNSRIYGVLGIITDDRPLEPFEDSIVMSVLGECALAIENNRNEIEKKQAALLAQNEQLRANLLRSISHDLRTPLTAISGNAENLLTQGRDMDPALQTQMLSDIYNDAQWLYGLIENLLTITRIEDHRLKLHLSTYLIDEVMHETEYHIHAKNIPQTLVFEQDDQILAARMDAKLIVQVLVNLIQNAVKYTPSDSVITVSAHRQDSLIRISVTDNGPGIPDEKKDKVFEMFYTSNPEHADGHRGMGMGLSLCRSIIQLHESELFLTDHDPHGCCFTFTLPAQEVAPNE